MPRVIIGLSDLIHKLGGVGFLPNSDMYGNQSRVTVRFPKLGTSVQSEPFLKHPDELAPAGLDMDPEGWNLIAIAAIHQGAGDCAVKNCKACNYQPEAAKTSGSAPLFFTNTKEEIGRACIDCAAVQRGEQIVCPQHSAASDIFMVQADTEAHLTLEDQPLTRLADLAEIQA